MSELARLAELGGWHGMFVWDHLWHGDDRPTADVWGLLAAIASNSTTLRLGPIVVPLPRYRPWDLARRAVTVDQLSKGRLILGLGAGTAPDFEPFSPSDPRRTKTIDNGVRVLRALLSGQPVVDTEGPAYRIAPWRPGADQPERRVVFKPTSFQPTIPIWGAAGFDAGDAPFRRAGREFDGLVPVQVPWTRPEGSLTPEELATAASRALRFRSEGRGGFEIVHVGIGRHLPRDSAAELVAAHRQQAGMSWWLEDCEDLMTSWQELRRLASSRPEQLLG